MKPEIKVLGIDDGFFVKKQAKEVLVIGVVVRGNNEVEGVLSTHVEQDGTDATKKLVEMVRKSRHGKQVKALMLSGTTLAGFNIVDITELSKRCGLPVMAVLRKKPDWGAVRKALANFTDHEQRMERAQRAGKLYSYRKMFFQTAGIDQHGAQEIIDVTMRKSNLPEPVRLAHLIASGVTVGESTKRA
jgi:endonuclease V-like protein UPF0215 family